MMFGSLFYNFWAALFSFTGYFIWAIQDPFAMPLPTIGAAFVAGVIGYFVMYIIRYFMGYVFYTPENISFNETAEQNENIETNIENDKQVPQNGRSTFEENNTEEIADVVRTMLHGQDEAVSK
ncbi:MAG: multidrug transporter [Solibacillus sp.]|jgi:hypothetical protein|uniref:multidrug transporter n=1 Tax=unclassified Solibacillus TaxID=2637870 RepID=UPI0030F5D16C